jgi:LytR cell envelope-related transcriptional attenuator
VVKGVLSSGLLSNPFRLVSVVSDAAASMTTDGGMSVSDLVSIAESLRNVSSKNVQFITAPNQAWPPDPTARVQFAQPQADEVFSAIAHDVTVPKVKVAPSATTSSGAPQVLTTSPSNVKVKILNGSGKPGIANQAATGLTGRGFDVTGTGNAASFAYTNSVIEYASTTDLAAVNTLKQQLTNVTDLQDSTLTPGTVELILGSDFTGLAPQDSPVTASATPATQSSATQSSGTQSGSPTASGSASPSASGSAVANLAQSNGGITAAASCASDSSAFAGPLSP